MAKDSKGWMEQDIGGPSDVATANAGLLAQAGASRGKAAEIAGMARAEDINALTKAGLTAYEGYVDYEASNRAKAVTEGLNTDTFQGPFAYKVSQDQADLAKDKAAAKEFGMDQESSVVAGFKERADRITNAISSGVFTQAEAQARLATDMRTLISTHPGQAERIRKIYNAHTGRGDWDVRPIESALTAQAKESAVQKTMMELAQKDAIKIYDSGIGSRYGMKGSAEVFQHIAQGTDIGVRMNTEQQANNFIEHANVVMTKGNMNDYFSAALTASGATRVKVTQGIIHDLTASGIDVNNMSSATEAQRPTIMNAYRDAKVAERNALEGAIKDLEGRLASNPRMDATVVNDTLDKLKKQLADTPLTKDLDSMLNELKMDATNRNMKADTVLKTHQIRDIALKTAWSDDMLTKMKDPRTRAQLVADYPNNPYVKQLAATFEGRQQQFSNELNEMATIADGLFNAAAPATHRAYAEAAANGTDEQKKMVAAVTQIEVGKGAQVLAAGSPATTPAMYSALTAAKNYTPRSKEFESVYQSVVSGKFKEVFKNDIGMAAEAERQVLARAERFMIKGDPNSYTTSLSQMLSDVKKTNPSATIVSDNGLLVLKNTEKSGMGQMSYGKLISLQNTLNEANKLLSVYNTLSGKTNRADKLATDILSPTVRENTALATPPAKSEAFTVDYAKDLKGKTVEEQKGVLAKAGVPAQFMDIILKEAGKESKADKKKERGWTALEQELAQ